MISLKDSGFELIGKIPSNKKVIRNKYNLSYVKGKKAANTNQNGIGLPIIGATELDCAQTEYSSYTTDDVPRCQSDDVLVLWDGARAGLIGRGHSGAIGSTLVKIDVNNSELTTPFLYWYLKGMEKYLLDCVNGTTIPHMSREYIEHLHMIDWSVPEQISISEILDKKCSSIDLATDKIQAQIKLLKEYQKTVIAEVMSNGLNPNVPKRDSGVEWIGIIPENWKVCRISHIYRDVYEPGTDDLPFLSVSINNGISNRELEDNEQERIFIRSTDKTKNKRVRANDLAYNMMRAWQGAFGAAEVDGMISSAYVVARPVTPVSSKYVEHLLRIPSAMEEIRRRSHGIADFRLRLYWSQFKEIQIALPEYSEQLRVVDVLGKMSSSIESTIYKKKEIIERMNDYKRSLIYEYVTGKRQVGTES